MNVQNGGKQLNVQKKGYQISSRFTFIFCLPQWFPLFSVSYCYCQAHQTQSVSLVINAHPSLECWLLQSGNSQLYCSSFFNSGVYLIHWSSTITGCHPSEQLNRLKSRSRKKGEGRPTFNLIAAVAALTNYVDGGQPACLLLLPKPSWNWDTFSRWSSKIFFFISLIWKFVGLPRPCMVLWGDILRLKESVLNWWMEWVGKS